MTCSLGTGPAHMTVAFMGLTGPLGALPRHYTELILERLRYHRDRTLRDFLDLFNHRLITLFYRAWEKYRVPIAYERTLVKGTGEDRFSQYLFDTIGLGTKGLRGRMAVQDGALLFYAGLLAQRPHSASALGGMLQDYFGVPVHIVQFVGAWLPLAHTDRSCLGSEATNNVLGSTALSGDRVWDQQATFQVQLGPLPYATFCRFLPTGSAFQPLLGMTRFYAGEESDFTVHLSLQAAEVPWCRLGDTGAQAPRLGWSTWLKTREFCTDATDAVFSSSLAHVAFPAVEMPSPGRGVAA